MEIFKLHCKIGERFPTRVRPREMRGPKQEVLSLLVSKMLRGPRVTRRDGGSCWRVYVVSEPDGEREGWRQAESVRGKIRRYWRDTELSWP